MISSRLEKYLCNLEIMIQLTSNPKILGMGKWNTIIIQVENCNFLFGSAIASEQIKQKKAMILKWQKKCTGQTI